MRLSECGTYWIVEGKAETYSLLPCIDCERIEGDHGHDNCKLYEHCIGQLEVGLPLKHFKPTKETRKRRGTDNRLA